MLVIRDLLDKQLVDRDAVPLGRVDAIVFELRDGQPPRVIELQVGELPLAERLGRWAVALLTAVYGRIGTQRSSRYVIPISRVMAIHRRCVQVNVLAESSAASDLERWLCANVIDRIPGAGRSE